MKKALLLAALSLSLLSGKSQINFEKTFGGGNSDTGASSIQTTDGGYIVSASSNSFGAGNMDIHLIRTDIHGDTLWMKTYGGSGDDYCSSITKTSDEGYLIIGYTNSFGAGDFDVYMIRMDANGLVAWSKTFGGIADDKGYSVQQTPDLGFIVAGYTKSAGAGAKDMYLIKTDCNGNSAWKKTYGGINEDYANSVQTTVEGEFIITGSTNSFGAGNFDVYVVKTDAGGNKLWSKAVGGLNADQGLSGIQAADGGFVITGGTSSFGAGDQDVYLIKMDSIGNLEFSHTYLGSMGFSHTFHLGGDDCGNSVLQTSDGEYIITGYATEFAGGDADVFLMKTDVAGNLIWNKHFGGTGNDKGSSVYKTLDNGFVIAGGTESFGMGNSDIYLIKSNNLGSTSCELLSNWSVSDSLSISSVSASADAICSDVSSDFFAASLTAINYNCLPTRLCSDDASDDTTEPSPLIYMSQGTSATVDNSGLDNTSGNRSVLLSQGNASINVYPNPGNGSFYFNGLGSNALISIYDMAGQLVSTTNSTDSIQLVDITEKAKGIYFYRISNGSGSLGQGKIIIK